MNGPVTILLIAAIACAGVAAGLLGSDWLRHERAARHHDLDGIDEWERLCEALKPGWWG